MKNTLKIVLLAAVSMISLTQLSQASPNQEQTAMPEQDKWVQIPDTTQNEVITYVNTQSITQNPDNSTWRDFEFIAQATPGANPPSIPENGSIALNATLDCSQGTARINQVRIYTQLYAQGEPAGTMAGSRSFQPQTNEASAQLIMSIVCKQP